MRCRELRSRCLVRYNLGNRRRRPAISAAASYYSGPWLEGFGEAFRDLLSLLLYAIAKVVSAIRLGGKRNNK